MISRTDVAVIRAEIERRQKAHRECTDSGVQKQINAWIEEENRSWSPRIVPKGQIRTRPTVKEGTSRVRRQEKKAGLRGEFSQSLNWSGESNDVQSLEPCMEKQSRACDTPAMPKPKRQLRVVKWLGTTPSVAVCTCCDRQFKIPLTIAAKTLDAQENLKMQFDNHKCKGESDAA